MSEISHEYVIVMAGGRGTRFWPASRKDKPKQFLPITNPEPMIRMTLNRIAGTVPPDHVYIVTGETLKGLVSETVPEIPPENILLEPVGRNTAPAVAWASQLIAGRDRHAVVAVLAADHVIEDIRAFSNLLRDAWILARQKNALITLGIKPDHPETGYGYLKIGRRLDEIGDRSYFQVEKFVEKPDPETAEKYVRSGDYLWNSGMFVFSVRRILEEMARHQPDILKGVKEIVASGNNQDVIKNIFPSLPNISIDYGIMEHADDIIAFSVTFSWADVGSWAALYDYIAPDGRGNRIEGNAIALDCSNTLVKSSDPKRLVAAVGLKDLIIVDTGDTVLVCHKDHAQKVGSIVKKLNDQKEWRKYL